MPRRLPTVAALLVSSGALVAPLAAPLGAQRPDVAVGVIWGGVPGEDPGGYLGGLTMASVGVRTSELGGFRIGAGYAHVPDTRTRCCGEELSFHYGQQAAFLVLGPEWRQETTGVGALTSFDVLYHPGIHRTFRRGSEPGYRPLPIDWEILWGSASTGVTVRRPAGAHATWHVGARVFGSVSRPGVQGAVVAGLGRR